MIDSDAKTRQDDDHRELASLIARARIIAGFTGAGISTESGVPDFPLPRQSLDAEQADPLRGLSAQRGRKAGGLAAQIHHGRPLSPCRPEPRAPALASLVAQGRMPAVVTQNIDGLHQRSGVPPEQVVELHGNGTYSTCLSCGLRHELGWVRKRFESSGEAPACRRAAAAS
jgi:NAD-dependent deacetylase